MESFPCPGCAEPMPVSVEVCPACRRPRTEDEVDAAREARRAYDEGRRALRRRLLLLAVLAGAGAAAYPRREALLAAVRSARAGLAAEYRSVAEPAGAKPLSGDAVLTAMQEARREAAEPPAPAEAAPPAPAPADPGPVKPFEDPGYPHPSMGRVYGVVYDLESLRPVHPARLVFVRDGITVGELGTQTNGRYFTDLSRADLDSGISVSVTAPGYRDGQLEDSGEPYRLRSARSRQDTMAETTDSDLGLLRVGRPDARGLVSLDLVLLPAKKGND